MAKDDRNPAVIEWGFCAGNYRIFLRLSPHQAHPYRYNDPRPECSMRKYPSATTSVLLACACRQRPHNNAPNPSTNTILQRLGRNSSPCSGASHASRNLANESYRQLLQSTSSWPSINVLVAPPSKPFPSTKGCHDVVQHGLI